MSLAAKLGRNWKGGLIGALLAISLGCALEIFTVGNGLVNRSYDLLFAPRAFIHPDEVRMIYMDEDSYKTMNQPLNAPWDRAIHARLLNYLKTDHARAVVFDIVFSDRGIDADADKSFAEAIQSNGKVVLAADKVPTAVDRNQLAWQITMPYPLFRVTNATIGTTEIRADDDLVVRKHVQANSDDQILGLSWTAASLVDAPITTKEKPYDHERWINYYGPPLTLPNVSYYRIFETTNSQDAVPAGYFSNKVVFIGAHIFTKFAGERKDEYSTPYSFWIFQNKFIPGVEAQATIFLNLLRGDWLSRMPFETVWILLAGLLFGYGLSQFRPLPALGLALGGAIVVSVLSYELFVQEHIFLAWLIVVAVQIPLALLWAVVFNSVQLYVENRLFRQSLQMYLSPKLVKKFSSEKDILKPGAKKQMLTILFSDIANFTSISEGLDSDELATLMNQYFESAVSNCIHATDGTIVKYIGDAIFSFWNAPDSQNDHALMGCKAALLFRDQPAHHINGRLLVTRIGLHTGIANVGNFGSTARVDYTAIGENINLASRMEGLNKYLGTEVLITADTQAGIAGRLLTRFLGNFQLKGFEKAVGVCELVGSLDKAEACRPLHEKFAEAIRLFQLKQIASAEAAFKDVLTIAPKDGPTHFYLKFISELSEHPLPEHWAGEVELKEK